MELHKNKDEFMVVVSEAAKQLNIFEYILEKDYWVTMLLKKIAEFEYNNFLVFKGGTSLSKGFGLITRFSEDIDTALKPEAIQENGIHKKSGEAIHRIIKKLKISDFSAVDEGRESEKQRYKRVYAFPKVYDYPHASPIHDKVVLEVNAFSNPMPVEMVSISSLLGEFVGDKYGTADQHRYGLTAFDLQALSPERSFCEKILAVRRASHKGGAFFDARVRHLYDLFQLFSSDRIKSFIEGHEFEQMLTVCHLDDAINQKITTNTSNHFVDSKLFKNPKKIIYSVEQSYNLLSSITFDGVIPKIDNIIATIAAIGKRLQKFRF